MQERDYSTERIPNEKLLEEYEKLDYPVLKRNPNLMAKFAALSLAVRLPDVKSIYTYYSDKPEDLCRHLVYSQGSWFIEFENGQIFSILTAAQSAGKWESLTEDAQNNFLQTGEV